MVVQPMRIRQTVGTLAAGVAIALAVPSAASAAPRLAVSPSQGLNPTGQIVVVSGSGYRPNVALFVMECRASSASDHTCNSVGLQKATTDASGSFSTRVSVVANFGATNCLQVPCAIKTSAVSGHATDRSEDVSAGIGFSAPAPAPTPPPATQPPTTQPLATQPPATLAPGAPQTTAAPAQPGATTTAPGTLATSTTTPGTATSTSTIAAPKRANADADSGSDDPGGGASSTEQAGGPVGAKSSNDDGGRSSTGPIVAGALVALIAVGGGTAVVLRRRSAGA